jgi:spermidine synthase
MEGLAAWRAFLFWRRLISGHDMVFYEHLGSAIVPGGVEIRLYRHEQDYSILLPDDELMSTRMRASEDLLAVQSLARIGHSDAPRMLIGGYGMGFTLRAALAAGGPSLEVVVAEIVPEIIEWALGPMAEVTAGCLDDPRVQIHLGDVGAAIVGACEYFDTILLDVDNGPDGVVRPDNDGLYSAAGLARAYRALRPRGVLSVWSAKNDPGFTRRLKRAGFAVEIVRAKSRPDGTGARHLIWFARKPG